MNAILVNFAGNKEQIKITNMVCGDIYLTWMRGVSIVHDFKPVTWLKVL